MMLGIALGALGVTAGGAIATYKLVDFGPKYADVLAVTPLKETVKTPREVCQDVVVTHRKPVQDQHRIAGTVIGALAGGLLGNQIGGGSGKKIATVAGAAAGGYAGNKVQENMQRGDTYTTTETKCNTVTDTHEKVVGYDVKYRLGEQVAQVRMDHEPGPRIPVKDGQLVLTEPVAAAAK
ncbi:glycine zipper 2TM domain-containing protein [Azoarcus sp. L1K30]|nr:glycine zipper 2TM domain-containing protein [Azoarcus sp. L1K30]